MPPRWLRPHSCRRLACGGRNPCRDGCRGPGERCPVQRAGALRPSPLRHPGDTAWCDRDAGVHARRHARRGQGGAAGRAARCRRPGDVVEPLSPDAAPGGRAGGEARWPARVHRLVGPDPHRLGRVPGLQPRRPAQGRRGRRHLPQPPRRLAPPLHARARGRAAAAARRRHGDGARRVSAVPGRARRGGGRACAAPSNGRRGHASLARRAGAGGVFGIVQGSIYPRPAGAGAARASPRSTSTAMPSAASRWASPRPRAEPSSSGRRPACRRIACAT